MSFHNENSVSPTLRAAAPSSVIASRRADRLCARDDGSVVRCLQHGESGDPATVRVVSEESSTAERARTANETIENAFAAFDPAYGVTAWAQSPVAR